MPLSRKMFASPQVVRQATQEVYGSAPSASFRMQVPGSRRAASRSQPKRESNYAAYTYSTSGRGYGYAVPPAGPALLAESYDYELTKNTPASARMYSQSGYSFGSGTSTYNRISFSARTAKTGTPYAGRSLFEDSFKEIRRRRDDEKNRDKSATYNRIRVGTRRHLGIADPLEVLGMGSMTKRSGKRGKTLERVTLKDELTWSKRPVYEFDGGYSTRKPKGRTRRR